MKLPIRNAQNEQKGETTLPAQFTEQVRPDLIARAVRALHANRRQPYGADPRAGKRASAELSRRRRKYRGSYGSGISRVPRKILSRRGIRMYWVGAFAPGTVGGRRAHPPKASKRWEQRINTRERRKAIRSALAATLLRDRVTARGHKIPEAYPFVLDASVELVAKTKEVRTALTTLGFSDELTRAARTTVRAGKATMRGRKTKRPTSILVVVGEKNVPFIQAAQNIAGLDVVHVRALNTELLAPGTHAGRATLFTTSALKLMESEKLFLDKRGAVKRAKRAAPTRKASDKRSSDKKPPIKEAAAKKSATQAPSKETTATKTAPPKAPEPQPAKTEMASEKKSEKPAEQKKERPSEVAA